MNEPTSIYFNDLLKEPLELLHGRISQSEVMVTVQEILPTVHSDYDRLLEVLQNLIDIGRDGFEGDMLVIYVRDSGIGIQVEIHSKGTGVELTLLKRIIEFHGSRICVDSETGRETTLSLLFPMYHTGESQ